MNQSKLGVNAGGHCGASKAKRCKTKTRNLKGGNEKKKDKSILQCHDKRSASLALIG